MYIHFNDSIFEAHNFIYKIWNVLRFHFTSITVDLLFYFLRRTIEDREIQILKYIFRIVIKNS